MPATRKVSTRNKVNGGRVFNSASKQFGQTTYEVGRNITQHTYVNAVAEEHLDSVETSYMRFPSPNVELTPSTMRRRASKKGEDHIPRPPNAFMLFRSDFVRQSYVPGSIETNHSSLSKMIGNCWKLLPDEEKAVWYRKASAEKAKHKDMYPDYRFRPVHNRKPKDQVMSASSSAAAASMAPRGCGNRSADKLDLHWDKQQREELITECSMQGITKDDLFIQIQQWDREHGLETKNHHLEYTPLYSSYSSIAIPTLPLLTPVSAPPSRPHSMTPSKYPFRRSSAVSLHGSQYYTHGYDHNFHLSLPLLPPLLSEYSHCVSSPPPETDLTPQQQTISGAQSSQRASSLPVLALMDRLNPSSAVVPYEFGFESSLLEARVQPYRTLRTGMGQHHDGAPPL
ncbi:hypothetical protein J3R30DRAFT_735506 [Lentinula aciculospora]|uniref:HMG box domain-containing protein n=1 Tax=Lentinula aciculospora TaxID=153920 RepID=A0A9W9DKE1_9AGAR|nr:hypothetical protein J3R30DRAFT_735506 [Lentinula aciculospora]